MSDLPTSSDHLPGDIDAFVTLYRRYQETVYRFAFQLSRSESVAEDITQDAFLILSRGARQYNARDGASYGEAPAPS